MCEESVVSELTLPRNRNNGGNSGGAGSDIGAHSNDVIAEMEKDTHGGDGGDSDIEGDECLIHESGVVQGDNDHIEPEDGRGKSLGIVDLTMNQINPSMDESINSSQI